MAQKHSLVEPVESPMVRLEHLNSVMFTSVSKPSSFPVNSILRRSCSNLLAPPPTLTLAQDSLWRPTKSCRSLNKLMLIFGLLARGSLFGGTTGLDITYARWSTVFFPKTLRSRPHLWSKTSGKQNRCFCATSPKYTTPEHTDAPKLLRWALTQSKY